jgi:predicted RecB family nuclease
LRRHWEFSPNDQLRRELIAYNIEDCRATELVADAIKRISDMMTKPAQRNWKL